uniref:Uncharacterized protein n=1 Tax=Rhizophora mucronata TaxID=61149 RepID=A0A2P2ITK5_RHIMU
MRLWTGILMSDGMILLGWSMLKNV